MSCGNRKYSIRSFKKSIMEGLKVNRHDWGSNWWIGLECTLKRWEIWGRGCKTKWDYP